MGEKILIIDDDALLLRMIDLSLQPQGLSVFTARDGKEGLALFHQIAPDLVILDIMMPGIACARSRLCPSSF
jgi:DNA-binding response OmpR family regulator